MRLRIFSVVSISLLLALGAACGDDESGSGGGSGGAGAGAGAGGSTTSAGGSGMCIAFGQVCTMGQTCCDTGGLTGICNAFNQGPRCTVACPSDPADCPNNGAGCNNKTPAICKTD